MKQREKYLAKLPPQIRLAILDGLRRIMTGDTAALDIKKMAGSDYQYRWKATKQIRVIYTSHDGRITIEKI
jgi:mRNA-degrading endonuclease RelE of RelBE toxin-antitoxin system